MYYHATLVLPHSIICCICKLDGDAISQTPALFGRGKSEHTYNVG